MRDGDGNDLRAFLAVEIKSRIDRCLGLFLDAFAEEFLRYADLHALDIADEGFLIVLLFLRDGRGVARIMACDRIEDNGCIGDVFDERSDLIKGGCESQKAVTGNKAIGRFQTDDAVEGRRLTDRSARVRAEGPDGFIRCNSCRRTTGGAARYIVRIPRIAGRSEGGALGRRTHGEFIHIRLAQRNIVFPFQLFDDSRIIRGYPVFKHAGGRGAGLAFDAHIIFDRARDTGKIGDLFSGGDLRIDLCCDRERTLIRGRKVSMDIPFYTVTMRDDFLCEFDSGDFLFHQLFMEIMNRVFHSAASLNNLRHFEIAVFLFRRIHECFFIRKRLMRDVFTHDIVLLDGMHGRRYISRIILVQFFHVGEDAVHGVSHLFQVFVRKGQTGKKSDLLSFFCRDFHRYTSLLKLMDNRESLSDYNTNEASFAEEIG